MKHRQMFFWIIIYATEEEVGIGVPFARSWLCSGPVNCHHRQSYFYFGLFQMHTYSGGLNDDLLKNKMPHIKMYNFSKFTKSCCNEFLQGIPLLSLQSNLRFTLLKVTIESVHGTILPFMPTSNCWFTSQRNILTAYCSARECCFDHPGNAMTLFPALATDCKESVKKTWLEKTSVRKTVEEYSADFGKKWLQPSCSVEVVIRYWSEFMESALERYQE